MKRKMLILVACLVVLACAAPVVADPSYIYGFHDPGGEYLMANKNARGWIVFTTEIGSDPNNYSGTDYSAYSNAGYGVIVRLNNGYGSAGTIPYESQYDNFAQRCENYVAASPGVTYWIIGNETNLPREWPGNNNGDASTGEAITVARYVSCYNKCWTKIRESSPSAKICPSPTGTWAPPYDGTIGGLPNRGVPGFVDYWVQCLNGIGATKIDGLILHTYTHGCDPALVTSEQKMGWPYETIYYHFRVYKNLMWAIPSGFTTKPVMITESNENVECASGGYAWYNSNNGWVRAAYGEINAWNNANSQKIRCLALFRWPNVWEGSWNYSISVNQGVIDDFNMALDQKYTWGSVPSTGTIAGRVVNSGGTGLSGATVSTTTGGYAATTNSTGYYTISSVATGTYSVVAALAGYNSSTQTGKTVNAGQTTTVNFTLTSAGGGTNLAPSAAIYLECGHNESSQRGKYLVDGSTSTKWCCLHNGAGTAGDHWVVFDLGNTATINSYVVKHASMGGEATYLNTKTFYIESASSMMGPWTQEFYVDNATTVASNTLTYGTAKNLRYIRLRVTKPNPSADWAVRIPEFEIWGTAGSAQPVTVEAENFDRFYGAVDGTDYHDTETTNQGGAYRTSGVDIETCSEGTYNVGWTGSGEWLMYPFRASTTTYGLSIRYAGTATGTVRLLVDGVDKTGAISLPSTGGWQTWSTVTASNITVTTGWHDIKLMIDSSGFNVNSFTLTPGGGGGTKLTYTEAFTSVPSWTSYFDGSWGSAATWSAVAGGQAGNCLQASRSSQGSSSKVKVYNVTAYSSYTVSIYMKCPSYSGGTYWIESACKLGSNTASDFDNNGSTWTMIKKFSNDGTNGNNNTWTQYSTTINTGSSTQLSIGFKHGASACVGPTASWDTLAIQ